MTDLHALIMLLDKLLPKRKAGCRHKRTRAAQRRVGMCGKPYCRSMAEDGKALCARHRTRCNDWHRLQRQRAAAHGYCARASCYRVPEDGKKLCVLHGEMNRRSCKKYWYMKRKKLLTG